MKTITKNLTLLQFVEKLKARAEVDALFIAGSGADETLKPHSDYDVIIVFKENEHKAESIFAWIDHRFADIFFFDHKDIRRITKEIDSLDPNNMDAIFLHWLKKGKVVFDRSGKITKLKELAEIKRSSPTTPQDEKDSLLNKINYNYVANTRYFKSEDPHYHEALVIRPLYSVLELVTAYFTFRNIPWRGEKLAITYLKESGADFYAKYLEYSFAQDVASQFKAYDALVHKVLVTGQELWTEDSMIPKTKKGGSVEKLGAYWNQIFA